MPCVFAALSILAIVGVVSIEVVALAERLALPWHYITERRPARWYAGFRRAMLIERPAGEARRI